MNYTRIVIDGIMMAGWFNFAAAVILLARPMIGCNMYPKEITKLVTPEPGHKKRVLIWIYGVVFLPVLAYSVISAYVSGIEGFWNLFFTTYLEFLFVNFGDLLGLDLFFREKMGRRMELPGTEGNPYYSRKLWMKSLALPEHLILWPFLMMPVISAALAGIGMLIR